jgi:hypothetical protein
MYCVQWKIHLKGAWECQLRSFGGIYLKEREKCNRKVRERKNKAKIVAKRENYIQHRQKGIKRYMRNKYIFSP